MKECPKCKNKYNLDKFDKISSKGYSVWCIECYLKEYGEEYRELIGIKYINKKDITKKDKDINKKDINKKDITKKDNNINKKDKDKNKSKYTKNNKKRKKYWNEFDYYSEEVRLLTEQNKNNIKNIEKRNFFTYHIDHKISIKYGFDNSISPEFIAHPTNLHILEKELNLLKNTRNIIDQENIWIWLLVNPEI